MFAELVAGCLCVCFAEALNSAGVCRFAGASLFNCCQVPCVSGGLKAFIQFTPKLIVGEVFVESQLLEKLANKSITKETLYKTVAADFDLLPEVLSGVSSPKAVVRYGCGSVLVELSAKYPKKLYMHMDRFVALLDSKYRILIWNALAVLANLCTVDEEKKFDAVFDKYFGFLNDEYLVTVANVVGNSGKIASAKQYLIPKITNELLKVENISTTPHIADECKLVIAEHAVKSFGMFFDKMGPEEKAKVLSFVKRHQDSPRKKLKTEADAFLKRWST